MTSLTEVYDGNARGVSRRRLYAGSGLVLCGAALAVVAVLVATTDLFADFVVGFADWGMAERFTVVRVAGVLAGMGVPAALVGVFIVLPAGRRVRAAAAISASLCLLGVVLFWHAYPENWRYGEHTLTLEVSAIYLLGLFTAVWCLFTAVVNFKTRNDPGGMLEMNVTRRNQTIVEVEDGDESGGGLGGIGFLGGTPDGDVETQTNADAGGADATASDDGTTLSFDGSSGAGRSTGAQSPMAGGAGAGAGATPTSDGGTAASDISSPLDGGAATEASAEEFDAEIVESAGTGLDASTGATDTSPDDHADRYCGNCRHFEYVRSSDGMVPYCARHDAAMDDMDACDEWTPNRREK
ncbi:DUF7139 domain-containing protein [Halopiger thermotolerans]